MSLRVLMFGWEFPPQNSGGLGTACQGIVHALSDLKCSVTFVLPRSMKVTERNIDFCFADIPNIEIIDLPGFFHPYINSTEYDSALADLNYKNCYGPTLIEEVKLYGLRVKEIIKNKEFDIIHAHDWLTYPAGIMAKEFSGKPLIAHVHATEFDRSGGMGCNPEVYAIEKAGMNSADGIIAISDRTREIIISKYGISPQKVRTIHNGIEHSIKDYSKLADFLVDAKNQHYKIVLFVGRLTLQKGPDYFIRAAAEVLKYQPKTYFIIAGSGDLENQTINQIAELDLADKIIFTGFLRGAELDGLYYLADLYVMPSVSEPFGLTPLESLQSKTPVLISHQSGVAEILQNALKVDFWDIEAMAERIIAVLNYPALQEVLAEEGYQETLKINWHNSCRNYIDYYQNFLKI